jgi:DNA-binding transcriptional ArsR family regulator
MVEIGRSADSREKSRAFLQAVYDNDGRADTTTIRDASGLTPSDMQYRYKVLDDTDLIDIEYESEMTGTAESPVKVAVLTELAEEEIQKGLLQGGQYQPESDAPEDVSEVAEELVELVERVDDHDEAIEHVQEYVSKTVYANMAMLRWSLARVELSLEEARVDLDAVEGVSEREAEVKARVRDFELD